MNKYRAHLVELQKCTRCSVQPQPSLRTSTMAYHRFNAILRCAILTRIAFSLSPFDVGFLQRQTNTVEMEDIQVRFGFGKRWQWHIFNYISICLFSHRFWVWNAFAFHSTEGCIQQNMRNIFLCQLLFAMEMELFVFALFRSIQLNCHIETEVLSSASVLNGSVLNGKRQSFLVQIYFAGLCIVLLSLSTKNYHLCHITQRSSSSVPTPENKKPIKHQLNGL